MPLKKNLTDRYSDHFSYDTMRGILNYFNYKKKINIEIITMPKILYSKNK